MLITDAFCRKDEEADVMFMSEEDCPNFQRLIIGDGHVVNLLSKMTLQR